MGVHPNPIKQPQVFGFLSPRNRSTAAIFLATGLLLIAFLIATSDLHRDSLWNDEAWTAWAIRSPYIRDILQRVEADVHPPLYFLLIGIPERFTGDSTLALRWPSALFSMIALAATYALGKQLVDRRTGLIALMLLGTASFFVYYAREARMYSLLMALAAVATWFYVRWRLQPTVWRSLIYSMVMAALLYTHYAGIFVIGSHVLHQIITQLFPNTRIKGKWYLLPVPYVIAAVLYAPWLPIFLRQMRSNPNGPLAIPVPTNGATVAALLLILTSGSWGLIIAPFIVGSAIPRLKQYGSKTLLLVLWMLITPIGLLALNTWFAPVYQVRYTIGMLPAGALLLAYGLRYVGLPKWLHIGSLSPQKISLVLAVVLVGWIAYTQLAMYTELWPSKPAWESTIRAMIDARKPLEATITDLAAYSPAAYYDRQLGLRRGIGLDLSWRLHTPDEVHKVVSKFDTESSIWMALPVNTAKSWQVAAQLDATRGIGYRSGLGNMIFYRFDKGGNSDLQFQFGERVRFIGTLAADQELSTKAGEALCVNLALQTLADIDNSFSVGLHLVDITGNINASQWDNGLGAHSKSEMVELKPCLDIPASVSAGAYHLELTIYNWSTLERLPILEVGGEKAIGWGDVLMMQAVNINP